MQFFYLGFQTAANSQMVPMSKTVFAQMVSKMSTLGPESLLLPHRVWKVKFVGESVDDCGGGYSDSIAEMCDELQVDLKMKFLVCLK